MTLNIGYKRKVHNGYITGYIILEISKPTSNFGLFEK